MRPALSLILAALAIAPAIVAGEAPPPAPATPPTTAAPGAPPAAGTGARGGDNGEGRMRWLVEQNPELKGVDPNTPEGQEKIRAVMQKRMEENAPRMRERMAEGQARQMTEIKTATGLSEEEFAAVQPLVQRVETLRQHRGLVDRNAGGPGGGGGMMGGRRGGGGMQMDPKLMLGDTPLDPTAAEIQAALKALKALIDDPQANATETELALVRVRKAREAWQLAMTKAQEELRAVLTRRQEAVLVDRGTLE